MLTSFVTRESTQFKAQLSVYELRNLKQRKITKLL